MKYELFISELSESRPTLSSARDCARRFFLVFPPLNTRSHRHFVFIPYKTEFRPQTKNVNVNSQTRLIIAIICSCRMLTGSLHRKPTCKPITSHTEDVFAILLIGFLAFFFPLKSAQSNVKSCLATTKSFIPPGNQPIRKVDNLSGLDGRPNKCNRKKYTNCHRICCCGFGLIVRSKVERPILGILDIAQVPLSWAMPENCLKVSSHRLTKID